MSFATNLTQTFSQYAQKLGLMTGFAHWKPWFSGYCMLSCWLPACWEPVCIVASNLHCSSSVLTSKSCRKIWIATQRMCFWTRWFPNISVFCCVCTVCVLKAADETEKARHLVHSHVNSSCWQNTKKLRGRARYSNPPVLSGCAPPSQTDPQRGVWGASRWNQTPSTNGRREVLLWDPYKCLSTDTPWRKPVSAACITVDWNILRALVSASAALQRFWQKCSHESRCNIPAHPGKILQSGLESVVRLIWHSVCPDILSNPNHLTGHWTLNRQPAPANQR